jgi:hypothetical protein
VLEFSQTGSRVFSIDWFETAMSESVSLCRGREPVLDEGLKVEPVPAQRPPRTRTKYLCILFMTTGHNQYKRSNFVAFVAH